MSAPTGLMTADEFEEYAGRTDANCELIRGEVRHMSPGNPMHGQVCIIVGALLYAHVSQNRLLALLGNDPGFVLERNPDTVRGPDVALVSRQAVAGRLSGWVEGAPALAVEVISPGNTRKEVREKLADYLAAGTQLIWIIDSGRRTVAVHRPGLPVRVLDASMTLDGVPVLPDFSCQVRALFPDD